VAHSITSPSPATAITYLDAGKQLRQHLPARGLPDCLDDLGNVLFLQRLEDGGVVLVELLALLLPAPLQAEFLDFIGNAESWSLKVSGGVENR